MATMNSGLGGASGYGENSMKAIGVDTGNLDDGSKLVDITSVFGPGGIDFYGTTYTGIYVNTNGLITFDGPETGYVPSGIAAYGSPAIAPFWTDVDITKGGDVFWDLDPGNGTVTITWSDVAPFTGSGVNSFQLVLTDNGSGDFEIEVIYEDIQWSSITYAGGPNQGTHAATAGITDGAVMDLGFEGSGDAAFMQGYATNDFDNGDPPGTYAVSVSNGTVPCFTPGTRIETARGVLAVEDIRVGDQLVTLERGLQPVIWTGHRPLSAAQVARNDALRPVIIRKGALGNARRMVVSQQHGFVVEGYLVRARHLAEFCGGKVARFERTPQPITYHHLMTPGHNLIRAEGAWSETLYPGEVTMSMLGASARLSLLAACPEISVTADGVRGYGPPARSYALRRDIRRGNPSLRHGILPDTCLLARCHLGGHTSKQVEKLPRVVSKPVKGNKAAMRK